MITPKVTVFLGGLLSARILFLLPPKVQPEEVLPKAVRKDIRSAANRCRQSLSEVSILRHPPETPSDDNNERKYGAGYPIYPKVRHDDCR
jgi:hypothetical protein